MPLQRRSLNRDRHGDARTSVRVVADQTTE
jgi:hypothetical protein